MRGFWHAIWRSPARAITAGAVLSVVISSILYGFNWHTFYDTRKLEARQAAAQIATDVGILAQATTSLGDSGAQRLQSALHSFLNSRHPRVTVTQVATDGSNSSEWTVSNEASIDTTRTQLDEHFTLSNGSGGELRVTVKEGNRPSLATALVRAWTFSLADYLRAPTNWWEHALYNRSIPLYGYLLTVVLVGFGTIRALYRDQQELRRLDAEGRQITTELDVVRATHVEEIDSLQEQITDICAQREEATLERDRLQEEVAGIDTEYQRLVRGAPAAEGGSTVAVRLRNNAARRSEARLALASYNEQVARFESELANTLAEMQAAEQLVSEVDDKREDLLAKLRDRNREIRKLQSLVQQAQRATHVIQLRAAQQSRTGEDPAFLQLSQDSIESQLAQWIRAPGEAKISFSEHSRASEVEHQLARIDRSFLDRYFTRVVNAEYERGARRLIRVSAAADEHRVDGHGELVVALDDAAGQTLGMRYNTRADAPGATQVGFVLAMLLRTYCRQFRHFSIRAS